MVIVEVWIQWPRISKSKNQGIHEPRNLPKNPNSPPASHEDALVKLLEVLSRRSQSLEVQDLRLGDLGDWRWDSIQVISFLAMV